MQVRKLLLIFFLILFFPLHALAGIKVLSCSVEALDTDGAGCPGTTTYCPADPIGFRAKFMSYKLEGLQDGLSYNAIAIDTTIVDECTGICTVQAKKNVYSLNLTNASQINAYAHCEGDGYSAQTDISQIVVSTGGTPYYVLNGGF
jgi:hypothetical protein